MADSTAGPSTSAAKAPSSSSAASGVPVATTVSTSTQLEDSLGLVCSAFEKETSALKDFTSSKSQLSKDAQQVTLECISELITLINRIPDKSSGEDWDFAFAVKQFPWFKEQQAKMKWGEKVCSAVSDQYASAVAAKYLTFDETVSELKKIRQHSRSTGPSAKLLRETVKEARKVATRIKATLATTHGIQVGDLSDTTMTSSSAPLPGVQEATTALSTLATMFDTSEKGKSVELLSDEEMEEHIRRLRRLMIRYQAASSLGDTVENTAAT